MAAGKVVFTDPRRGGGPPGAARAVRRQSSEGEPAQGPLRGFGGKDCVRRGKQLPGLRLGWLGCFQQP